MPAKGQFKTHCKRGHEFTAENIYPSGPNGGRACRTCVKAKAWENYKRRNPNARHMPTPTERFWANVDKLSNGCWAWIGKKQYKGYGILSVNNRAMTAHRFSWSIHNGGIPPGQCVCHSCDRRDCVNPEHLFLGSSQENTSDMIAKGRAIWQRTKSTTIGGVGVGAGFPCVLIAEIGNAHNGDFNVAIRLLDAAKASGATVAKFQCYSTEELIALRGDGPAPEPWADMSMSDLYSRAMTPRSWFAPLAAYCDAISLPWFASVFGAESLDLLESLACPTYKLAALDFSADHLRAMVEKTGKPIIRSASTPTAPPGAAFPIWCPPGYPQKRMGLSALDRGYGGFSYHGTSIEPCKAAVARGARLIEAHFQLDDVPCDLESGVSLSASQFRNMVDDVREIEAML